nr:hypothetical protein CFP56_03002 [Quercus suber]
MAIMANYPSDVTSKETRQGLNDLKTVCRACSDDGPAVHVVCFCRVTAPHLHPKNLHSKPTEHDGLLMQSLLGCQDLQPLVAHLSCSGACGSCDENVNALRFKSKGAVLKTLHISLLTEGAPLAGKDGRVSTNRSDLVISWLGSAERGQIGPRFVLGNGARVYSTRPRLACDSFHLHRQKKDSAMHHAYAGDTRGVACPGAWPDPTTPQYANASQARLTAYMYLADVGVDGGRDDGRRGLALADYKKSSVSRVITNSVAAIRRLAFASNAVQARAKWAMWAIDEKALTSSFSPGPSRTAPARGGHQTILLYPVTRERARGQEEDVGTYPNPSRLSAGSILLHHHLSRLTFGVGAYIAIPSGIPLPLPSVWLDTIDKDIPLSPQQSIPFPADEIIACAVSVLEINLLDRGHENVCTGPAATKLACCMKGPYLVDHDDSRSICVSSLLVQEAPSARCAQFA